MLQHIDFALLTFIIEYLNNPINLIKTCKYFKNKDQYIISIKMKYINHFQIKKDCIKIQTRLSKQKETFLSSITENYNFDTNITYDLNENEYKKFKNKIFIQQYKINLENLQIFIYRFIKPKTNYFIIFDNENNNYKLVNNEECIRTVMWINNNLFIDYYNKNITKCLILHKIEIVMKSLAYDYLDINYSYQLINNTNYLILNRIDKEPVKIVWTNSFNKTNRGYKCSNIQINKFKKLIGYSKNKFPICL